MAVHSTSRPPPVSPYPVISFISGRQLGSDISCLELAIGIEIYCRAKKELAIEIMLICTECVENCSSGQQRCVSYENEDQCCNWYVNNTCAVSCPAPLIGNSTSFDCGEWLIYYDACYQTLLARITRAGNIIHYRNALGTCIVVTLSY